MKTVFSIPRLIDTELHFAKRFTGVIQKPWGLIYWNEANKLSWDSNHAIVTDFIGVEATIKEIVSYYRSRGISPRVFSSMKDKEMELLVPRLIQHDFTVEHTDTIFMLHETHVPGPVVPGLRFIRIKGADEQLRSMILGVQDDSFGEWTVKVFDRHLRHPGFHLIGAYLDEELVGTASVNVFEGYSRIDDVFTKTAYRGRGFSSALIGYLVDYHKQISENHLYLYSAVPQAIRIYNRAGFVQIAHDFHYWSAHKTL